jgi:hypothetical protein
LVKAVLKMLDCIFELEKKMTEYRDYIEAQDAKDIYLFQWAKFTRYETLHQATTNLNKAFEDLTTHVYEFGGVNDSCGLTSMRRAANVFQRDGVPRRVVLLFFNSALRNSISISNTAQTAFETMNHKIVSCFEEVDQSTLSEGAKDIVKTEITDEVTKLMKHTTESTRSVYAALDILLRLFYRNTEKGPLNLVDVIRAEQGLHTHKTGGRKTRWPTWKILTTCLLLSIIAMTVFGNRMLYVENPQQDTDASHLGKMIYYLQKTDVVRRYQNKVVQASLRKLDSRCKSIEEANECIGARLDNIVESLGPPNEDGMYFSESNTFPGNKQSDALILNLQKQNDQLSEEVIQLRKHIHRVDLRLTKDVEKLKRKG